MDTLDLAEIDPAIWRVMVKDAVYGPYTLGQMRSFVLEGRLSINSKTAGGDGGAFIKAGEQPGLTAIFREHFATQKTEAETRPTNHVIIARTPGDSRNRMISVLNELGSFAEVMPGVYLINTTIRTAKLRERLGSVADDADRVLIVNADTGRLAWLGLGPEIDVHIRSVWKPKS